MIQNLYNNIFHTIDSVSHSFILLFLYTVDIDDPLGDLLLSDDENQKPKTKDKPLTTSATNVTSRTDQKSAMKEKSSFMDDLFGNTGSSSKSDSKITIPSSKPLSGLGGGIGTSADAKMNEGERYMSQRFI